jgi:hypothetical protein
MVTRGGCMDKIKGRGYWKPRTGSQPYLWMVYIYKNGPQPTSLYYDKGKSRELEEAGYIIRTDNKKICELTEKGKTYVEAKGTSFPEEGFKRILVRMPEELASLPKGEWIILKKDNRTLLFGKIKKVGISYRWPEVIFEEGLYIDSERVNSWEKQAIEKVEVGEDWGWINYEIIREKEKVRNYLVRILLLYRFENKARDRINKILLEGGELDESKRPA